MYKSKRQVNKKSFDWYGLSQRFSIRKYHFGAASVLLGTALILGSPQATAKADDTVSTPTTQTSSEQGADAGSSSTTDSLKNVTLPTTASTTEATVLEKPELSAEEIAKATSSETTAATTEKAKEESKPAASDAVVKTIAEEKTKTDKLTEKETKAEEKAEKKEDTASQKTILTQLTSEAEVLNTTAANYAEKKVEDKASKDAIASAVAAAKVEIAASKKVLEAEEVTKAELDAQLQRISSAIEAVYAEMKRGGHIGKVEAMLADVSATVKTPEKTRVRNTSALTDEEVEGIIRQVRIANPNLTDADKISVFKNSGSANNAGEVTITYANGDTAKIASGDAVIGAGVARNVEGLKDAINWFEFSAASIVYPDGTEVGPARYLSTPKRIQVDHPREDGTKVTANLNIVRDVKYADGTTGLTTDDKFLNSGITEFTVHEYYTGGFQNNNEAYEVLKEGMVLKVPTRVKGYNLTLRVEKLAPKQVATDPNNTATRGKNAMNAQQGEDKRFKPVKMILTTQDTTNSYLYKAGMKITDKNNKPALATITTNRDGANAGVTFSASATFNGQPVPVNLVAADGEESGRAEVLQFETNGSNWKELMSINLTEKQQTAEGGYKLGGDVTALTAGTLDFYAGYTRNNVGYNAKEWVNRVQDTDAQGNPRYDSSGQPIMKEVVYGSKLFGPTWNAMRQGNALGFGFSENVTQFSMYMNSAGAQAGSIGFVVYDGGDAPQSYGSAQHVIGSLNRVDSSGRQVVASQPYFGSEPGDPDFRSTATDPSGAWVLDDLVSTNGYKVVSMKEGNTVTNEAGETGTYKLVDVNGRKTPVLLKADGSTTALKTGEILKITNPEDNFPVQGIFDAASQGVGIGTLPDEGKGQILDKDVAVDYKLRQATDDEYVLDGIKVNSGENNEKAYARGWVDFNNNGVFDEGESSDIVEVTGSQTVSFKFKKTPQLLNTSIDSVGVRLRIALDKKEILAPTGLASSGEVEDFETHVIHPPRGTENKTQDLQGKPQNLTINTTDLFTATGKTEASKYATWNQIDNNVAPKFVVTDSVVASETETGNTVNITDQSGTTVYNGKEVVIRDARGNELGTAVKVTNPLNNTTEYLLSQYTEYDTAGNKVGVYTLNKDNNGLNKAGANGIYKTTIDFQPEKAYVGTAKGVAIRAWDENRISTGWNASEKTIEESKKSVTLADKDKILENVNKGINNRNSMDSTYIPTVIDVRPVGEDLTTTDVQGKEQTGAPKIPAYGTVETVTGDKIVDVKYTSDFVILNTNEKPKFGAIKTLDKDTVVTEPTTITLEDGSTKTYKPTTLPAGTPVFEQNKQYTVTGTGDFTVTNVNYGGGVVPTGAKLVGKPAKTVVDTTVIRNGVEVVVPKGERLQIGDVLVTPLGIQGEDQRAFWEITYKANENVPGNRVNRKPEITLKNDTSVDQLVGKGTTEFTAANGKTYYVGATETIPKGTRVQLDTSTPEKLAEIKLPDAIHIDPSTGVVTSKPRKYTKFTDDEIVIQNEGTYRLNRDTGVVTFTPEPTFVGTGTGVELDQPDIDYNNKVAGDKVTDKYGTDYGHARYTPIVTPSTSASITRTIHYVYENDNDNPSSSDSYKDNKEILAIDGEPVVTKQTLNYTRTYKIFEEDGVLEEAMRSAIPVTDVTGRTYSVGTEIPAGTKFPKGQVIISEWKAGDQNSVMRQVISPTVKGYTANVVTADFTAANAQGKMGHIHNNKQPVGLYTPVPDNTRDVGEYEPLVSEVTSDKTDDFDMYVVYKRDTQKANVVYIDLDEKGDKRVLEIQSGLTEADLTAANKQKDAKTEYNVAELRGKSDTKIPYDTATTIKKYTDKGYELASDDYKNDENGRALADGRNFDEDSTNDQTFYVYLRHKKEQLSKNDVRTVTRHIEYKYADTAEVPADKRGQAVETTLAKKVTEVLTFERTRTIDMATTAKLYETQYNAYKAVAANNAVGSDAEVEARATLFKYVEDKAKEAGATAEAKAVISYGEWQAKPGQATNLTLSAAEENIKDSKFNDVVSPTVPGYLPDNAKVEATADINPESDPKEYTVTVTYSPGDQKAIVNFVEVDATNTDQVITPGLADPVTLTGKSGTAFPTTASTSVQAKIDELVKKGYELVPNGNGFVSTDSFDTNAEVDQTYTVKLKAKKAPVVPTDNVTPVPGQPVDPSNPNGPKWPESVKNLVNKDTVKRTIKYVYEDGTPVIDPATGAQKVVEQTAEFTRTANVNLVTGDITYGAWTPAEGTDLVAVTSPTSTDIPAVAKYVPSTATVPVVKVQAGQDDITETVVYRKANPVTVQPNDPTPTKDQPIDPNNTDPNAPKWTEELLKKLEDARKEEVTRTITYKYSTETSELKAEDAAKAGQNVADTVTNTVTFKRPVTIDPITKEFTYGDWVATNGTTLAGKADLPVVAGYVATGDVEASKKNVENVKATDKDITENVVYKTVGKYVPVIPEGITPPANTNVDPKPYNNDPQDGSKVKDPDPTNPVVPGTTTPIVPQIPGTTPVGPDGKPLKPVDPADPSKGYVPPTPTDPTKDTSIIYVKDGSQVAVVHFVDEKGRAVNESVVETGDTGNAISKTNVDAVKAKLEAKGYTVVEPTDALYTTDKEGFYKEAARTFDAVSDKSTGTAGEKVPSQQYYVIVKAKEIPADPTKPGTTPGTDTPTNPTPGTDTPAKPGDKIPGDPLNRTYGDLGLVEEVTRTINYVKNDGSKAADPVKETLTFTRKAKINAVTGEVTYLAADGVTPVASKDDAPWTAANGTEFKAVKSPTGAEKPELANYTPSKAEVEAKTGVTATDEDIVETVVYNQTTETVDPKDPNYDPEKPLDPNNPNGPKYKDLKLKEDVKRTITYTYANDVEDTTKRGTDAAPKFETTVEFTRTATINKATGEVTYSDWAAKDNDTTLEKDTKDLPSIPGYVATGDLESIKKDVENVNATDKDIIQNVVYKDLGKYVPVVPEGTTPPTIENPKYPNHPTDPTKPGKPTTTIPNVPGLTPLDPSTGKPLEPKDPNDLTKGYKPPVPQVPSENTNIVYVPDGSQVSVVHFVDEDGKAVHTSFVEAGNAGAKFAKAGEVTKVVDELKAAGYVVVPNKAGQAEYPGEAGVFDSVDDKGKDGVSQVYYVTVAKTVPVTPTTPQNPNEDPQNPNPGDPINPKNPNGPKWTEDALNKLNNIKSVTRTITYIKDGTDEEVSTTEAPKVTNKVNFTRTVVVNPKDGSVVGYDTNGDGVADVPATDTTSGWTAAGTAKFAEVKSPVVKGYVVKPNQDTQGDLVEADGSKVKASTTDLTVDSPNQDLKVRYVAVGKIVPKIPEGETPSTPASETPYGNDPKDPGNVVTPDPTKPTDPQDPNSPKVPVVPHVPGYTPKDPNGNPLKPVDPEDPTKGYVPPTPTTPTENTEINYEKDTQKAVTKFVDPSGKPIPGVTNIEETGKSGEPLTKATEVTTEITKLIAKGYDLVSNNYGQDNNGNFDKDSGKDQEYKVVLTPHVEPIKPFDPTNPNDPNTPKPGQPIDPKNPDGPKWTPELIKQLDTTKHVTRTITYVDDKGNKVEYTDKAGNKSTADVTDKVTFTREAKINVVTGAIEYGKWTPVNNDTTFDKVTSPVVPGYVLKDPAQKEVAETTGLTENSKDETIRVVYVPVGKLVPKVPEGVTPPTPTPYENDPKDPGKVVPPSPTKPTDPQDPNSPKVPVIPHIPGTTPQVPKDPTKPVDPNTNPLVPLKPVDPKDPSKGYEVPPVPTNPGTDTPIIYTTDKQKAITNFVDNNGKVVSDPVVDQGDSGSKFTKSGEVAEKIKELVKKGYVVTSNDYPSADTDRVFDNDKDKDQIFNVKVTPMIVPTDPNSPDKPQVPTDPTKPVGPNNPLKPVTPSTPEPGKPVFPEDPNSPVWPETVKDMVTETTATRTITYVDRNGNQVAVTHTETIKFKRTAKVNLVTGEITYGEWTVEGKDTILDGNKLPKVDGYIARGGNIESSQKDIEAKPGVNITETVVYDKLGSWIPRLPEGQDQVPPTPYPNDPTDPTKPGTDKPKVPYVPGFIPVDPNGNPLKPVDPNDPTKGYEVPDVPADPTQDTPIKYIPVPKPNDGGGNNGGGGGNTPTPQPQPNPTPQPEPSPAPVPVTPETPEQPVAPVTPEQPAEPATPQYMDGQRELPNTGTEANSSLAALGLLGALSGFGLIARKKRKDEE